VSKSEGAPLLPLAESIADGSAVDWEAAEARATSDERAIIQQLRVLSNLAGLHRSMPRHAAARPPLLSRVSNAPAIGSWGHLALLERLGGGTFGDVYRVWDNHLEREVALKLLRIDDAVDLQASRIATEGRLLARVRHPNVITVHGVDVHDQRVGLWMELVRGATLEQRLHEHGPFSAREAALVGIDLCRALAAIHAAGLIHRDVKAQNVMREDGGRIVLMDLGTGREMIAGERNAAPELAGTPLYLAPEIFSGAVASERTDIYSLGVLLYHLASGSFPVRATTFEGLQQAHLTGAGMRLRDARADLPTAFVQVVDRAIAADPDRRYQSAGALEADLAAAFAEPVALSRAVSVDTARTPETEQPRGTRRLGATLLLALLSAAVLVAAIAWPTLRGRRTVSAPAAIRSIAVLPLVNASGDPLQEYFADGMTDELIGTLGRLGSVNVISRTSSMQFKRSTKGVPEIARALHVDAILEGSVLVLPMSEQAAAASKRRVRVNARLIYAGTDTQLWDRTFEAVVSDVFGLHDQIAKAISDAIHVKLTSVQAARPTPDFEAFDLYLKGRYYWNMRTQEGLTRSIQYFQEAIQRRPDYALAHAGLADAHSLLGYYGFVPVRDAHARAAIAATRALELDESLAEAHASLAYLHEDRYEWDEAEARYRRALALKPGYATAHHWYGYQLAQRGRVTEGLAELRKAAELDPLSVGVNGTLGAVLVYARRYDEAIAQLEQTVRMDPGFARSRMELAKAYLLKGVKNQAISEADRVTALHVGDAVVLGDIGYIQAAVGHRSEAQRIAREITARYRQGDESAALATAVVYAGLGDRDEALRWFERARQVSEPELSDLRMDPRFDWLHGDARFTKLLAAIGLTQ
jgi:eukaryotic-like serine/threonine-protein kinase